MPADIFAGYDSAYLDCRDLRHAWTAVGTYRGTLGGYHRWLVCGRCGTERYDHWTAGRFERTYRYPDGYAIQSEGGTRVTAREVRDAVMARTQEIFGSLDELKTARVNGGARVNRGGRVVDLRAGAARRRMQAASS